MPKEEFFKLEIIRPTKKEIFDVEWIEIQSPTGNFVIGYNHSPLISILKDRGVFSYKIKGNLKEDKLDTYGGIFSLVNNQATVILDL